MLKVNKQLKISCQKSTNWGQKPKPTSPNLELGEVGLSFSMQKLLRHPVVSATNKSKWRANGLGIYGACRKAMQNLMRQFLTWIDYLVTCAVVFTLFWQTYITVLKKLSQKSHFSWKLGERSEPFEFFAKNNKIFFGIFKSWFIWIFAPKSQFSCWYFEFSRQKSLLGGTMIYSSWKGGRIHDFFLQNKQCFHSEDDFFIMQKSQAFSRLLPKVPTKMAQSWPWKEQSWTQLAFHEIHSAYDYSVCFWSQKGDQVERSMNH